VVICADVWKRREQFTESNEVPVPPYNLKRTAEIFFFDIHQERSK
jgi:hypothetical protein